VTGKARRAERRQTGHQAILAAIAEEGFKKLNATLESASGSNAVARLIAAGRPYIGFALSHAAHFQVMFRPELVNLESTLPPSPKPTAASPYFSPSLMAWSKRSSCLQAARTGW
jgi:hypothetical protein